ncbi:FMN adenylyltransferase /riboflavin kinase [Malonomonas rubra DSM 5091]|uniref:Riboflavin biosynthesis protein n=1 Tax=Malonomonas rubra DSM 5091 TaxID=1122189 RepID=A0A1M6D8N3_MALRU|nr:bifunctional riboflavin kinase/FAD synthetase [Malonomonas rubra]SHI69575.1 FMN adenylyltransferase /riboflavin kinase [Malonomonas rubra DSM 5091]
MEILNNLSPDKNAAGPCVVSLGNFDGVHLGHRELFRQLVAMAKNKQCRSVVYTFSPHPLKVLFPDKSPLLLNTPDEKRRLIEASHIDTLIEAPFTQKFAAMSPERFVDEILVAALQARGLVIGYDYAFGKNRAGNAEFLQRYCSEKGIDVLVLQPVGSDGLPYSSTRIRQMLMEGKVAEAVNLLGRHYNLEGTVVAGKQRGRKLGFPTANLVTDKEQLPAAGVYAVKVRYRLQEYNGVVNLGKCPTFANDKSTIEVHLLDFSGDLYGDKIRIYFVERLRDEKTFSGLQELTAAIEADIVRARQILGSRHIIQYQEYLSY